MTQVFELNKVKVAGFESKFYLKSDDILVLSNVKVRVVKNHIRNAYEC